MILKKQEKDNKIKAIYSSTNVLASIYDKGTSDLTIIFNKGTQYKYPKVSVTDYTRFEIAESQGVVFNSHIKKYTFEKLDAIDPVAIIKEIDTLKGAETKAFLFGKQDKLVRAMKQLLLTADAVDTLITDTQLSELATVVKEYLTEYLKTKPVVA